MKKIFYFIFALALIQANVQAAHSHSNHQNHSSKGDCADFYALMPSDNPTPIVQGTAIAFPKDGPSCGNGISRLSASTFNLAHKGMYHVSFEATISDQLGQLVLSLNGVELPYTVVGRTMPMTQIVGTVLVKTTKKNSILSVNNPRGNNPALTLLPNAGQPAGIHPVSAHLVIMRIK